MREQNPNTAATFHHLSRPCPLDFASKMGLGFWDE
jgi:hypothetical protein